MTAGAFCSSHSCASQLICHRMWHGTLRAGPPTTLKEPLPQHVPKVGNGHLRDWAGKQASLTPVSLFFSLVIGLAVLTYSKIPLEDYWK